MTLGSAVFADEVERLMVLGSAGRDVAAFLHEHYPDEALDILTHTADGGLTSLRAQPPEGDAGSPLTKSCWPRARRPPPRALCRAASYARFEGSPAESGSFRDGYFHVEGQASQLAALCVEAKPGDTVLDLCAAPGGKSLLLIEGDGGRRAAGELRRQREPRPAHPQGRGRGWGFAHVEPRVSDGTKPDADLPMADAILVDAPCSGLGILAKKPDIRYKTLEKARHDELLATQSAILDTAAAHLKEGGRLVYSTCTIDPAENEEQVRAFVGRHPEFRVVTPDVRFPAGMTVGDWGALSVPTRTGMDGFSCACCKKPPQRNNHDLCGSYPLIGEQNGTKTLYLFLYAGRADR